MLWKPFYEPFRYEKIVDFSKTDKTPTKKRRKAKDTRLTLQQIWQLLTVQKALFYLVVILVICSSALSFIGPVLLGNAIDHYIVAQKTEGLWTLLLILLFVYIFYSLSMWLQNYIMIGLAQRAVAHLRTMLFNHLHKLPLSFFDKRQQGELMSRVTNDIENVSSTLNSSVIQLLASTLTIVGTFSVMLWLSPLLTLITFIIVPVMFLCMRWITKRTGALFQKQQQNLGALNGIVQESISGQAIIKAFSQEEYVSKQFGEKASRLKQSAFWAQTYSGMIPKLMNVLNNLSFALIAGFGGLLAIKGMVSIGVIVIFVEFARQFTRPLNELANQFNTLLSALAGAERVFDILNIKEETHDEKGKALLTDVKGKVEFDKVSFSYNQEKATVKNISFVVQPGEMVALVGATGAGKTTIINLLSRFYECDQGEIKIDDQNVTAFTRDSLRQQMAFVLQESFLFQGSIMENIRYGHLEASDEEVIEAAKQANAHHFIEKLSDGYQTVLADGGSGLSQGQKQLLAIARALLSHPKILILDEATSNIDTITELHIQQALKRLMHGRTCFIIAHRLNTVREADQIMVLQEGELKEKGSHTQLIQQKGLYYRLVTAGLPNE